MEMKLDEIKKNEFEEDFKLIEKNVYLLKNDPSNEEAFKSLYNQYAGKINKAIWKLIKDVKGLSPKDYGFVKSDVLFSLLDSIKKYDKKEHKNFTSYFTCRLHFDLYTYSTEYLFERILKIDRKLVNEARIIKKFIENHELAPTKEEIINYMKNLTAKTGKQWYKNYDETKLNITLFYIKNKYYRTEMPQC